MMVEMGMDRCITFSGTFDSEDTRFTRGQPIRRMTSAYYAPSTTRSVHSWTCSRGRDHDRDERPWRQADDGRICCNDGSSNGLPDLESRHHQPYAA